MDQGRAAELPSWIRTCPQPAKSRPRGELVRYPLVNSEGALLWMVEYGAVDLHVWTSRCDRPERPDFVLFDLDPAGAGPAEATGAALVVREALAASGSRVSSAPAEGLASTCSCRSPAGTRTNRPDDSPAWSRPQPHEPSQAW
jgi:hypothetical protein